VLLEPVAMRNTSILHFKSRYFKRATGDHVVKTHSSSDWNKMTEEFPVSVLFITSDDSHDSIVQVSERACAIVFFPRCFEVVDASFWCKHCHCCFLNLCLQSVGDSLWESVAFAHFSKQSASSVQGSSADGTWTVCLALLEIFDRLL
jgi:hypothetical protein